MQIAIDELDLPLRLRTDRPMTDEEFMRFSGANEPLRMEQESDGEIVVMSPNKRLSDLQAKMGTWLANGVQLAWVIDPERRSVEVYRPGQPPQTLEACQTVEGESPLAGFVLNLSRIWI